jgi:NAD(P)-dependent dehydrogenase (short-subunit alcohol dehydrogenase family)
MEQIDRFYAEVSERFGRLDVLVNNAAANPYFGSILSTDIGSFQKTVDVNIRGYFFMCLKGAQLMVQNGGGSIINVASVNGVIPGMSQGIYSITKAAIISMTKTFALECAPSGVRVNTLLPGPTDTKFASVLINTAAIREQILDHVPMKRVAQPDEMAGAVLYLASPAASYTTGSCITVDGGYLLA